MDGMHAWWWLFWAILIVALFVALRGRLAWRQRDGHESPDAVLKRRLAEDDITPQQYEEHKTLLDRNADKRDDT